MVKLAGMSRFPWLASLAIIFCLKHIQAQSTNTIALRRVTTGLNLPVVATAPRGDSNRLFVVEQHTGRIRMVDLEPARWTRRVPDCPGHHLR